MYTIDNNSYYGHIKSGDSLNFHTTQYHARILSHLLDDTLRHFRFSGTVATQSNRSPKGWAIYPHIYGQGQHHAYLCNHLQAHGMTDLIEWLSP